MNHESLQTKCADLIALLLCLMLAAIASFLPTMGQPSVCFRHPEKSCTGWFGSPLFCSDGLGEAEAGSVPWNGSVNCSGLFLLNFVEVFAAGSSMLG